MQDLLIDKTFEEACNTGTMVVSVGIINRNSRQYRTGYLDSLNHKQDQGVVASAPSSAETSSLADRPDEALRKAVT